MGTQLSIFVENKPGKLEAITKVLADNRVNVRGITLASAGEFGVVKILADDPERAFEVLKAAHFTVSRRRIVIVMVEDSPGSLHELLRRLSEGRVNIEDCYGIALEEGKKAAIVLDVEEYPEASGILKDHGYRVLSDAEIHSL